jgi:hypothetical protein
MIISSPVSLFVEVIKRTISVAIGLQKIRPENLLPLCPPFLVIMMATPLALAFKLWLTGQASSNFGFLSIVTLMSNHHHHDLFH